MLITSDMPEIIDVADRVLVMADYRIKGMAENDRNDDAVSKAITGLIHERAAQGIRWQR